jgi:Ni/Co efflux regulator RcnB
MKKLLLALVAAFAISAPAFADQNDGDESHEKSDDTTMTEQHHDMDGHADHDTHARKSKAAARAAKGEKHIARRPMKKKVKTQD